MELEVDLFREDDDEVDPLNLIIFGIPRRVHDRADHFHSFDNLTFFQRYRITKNAALYILELIENDLEYPNNWNNSVPPINQLLIFLRFCATGSHLACIADVSGVHLSTVSRTIVRVSRALVNHYGRYIFMPRNNEEMSRNMLDFYRLANFPRVIGTIDCTHVRIQSPGGDDAEIFRNRKGYFSLNVQAVVSAELRLMNLLARWPGSCHDATIFNNSRLKNSFETGEFRNAMLLGDNGYFFKPYLFTPLLNPETIAEQTYNRSHIQTRNTVQRFFGVWKRRFPVLAYGCRLKLRTFLRVIVATGILYNICKINGEEDPPEPEDIHRFNLFINNNVPYIIVNDQNVNMKRAFINHYFNI